MNLFYQILIIFLLLITSPYLLVMTIIGKHGLRERLGCWRFKSDDRKVVWFHAASMGELKAINSILPELFKINGDLRIVISTMTKTGKCQARKLFNPIEVFYLSLDLRCCVKRVMKKVKPSLLVLVETEIWPNLISEAKSFDANICIINARISDKSLKFYDMFKSLFASSVSKIDFVMAQNEQYGNRYKKLGALPDRVASLGNIKFDQVLNQDAKPLASDLDNYISRHDKFVFIAGSIWPKEFPKIIASFKELLGKYPELSVILAPRHMKNLGKLEETLSLEGLPYIKRSLLRENNVTSNIMILDTMGELSGLYRYADLAFVGGSMVNIGGHDPLEPASAGCPVCFGPRMENSPLFVDILIESGGAFYVNDETELKMLIKKLLDDKSLSKELGRKAYQAVMDNSGVSQNIAAKLAEFIK